MEATSLRRRLSLLLARLIEGVSPHVVYVRAIGVPVHFSEYFSAGLYIAEKRRAIETRRFSARRTGLLSLPYPPKGELTIYYIAEARLICRLVAIELLFCLAKDKLFRWHWRACLKVIESFSIGSCVTAMGNPCGTLFVVPLVVPAWSFADM